MVFLAKGIMIVKNNSFKVRYFQDKEKALRFWKKCKRRGLDAQLVY